MEQRDKTETDRLSNCSPESSQLKKKETGKGKSGEMDPELNS